MVSVVVAMVAVVVMAIVSVVDVSLLLPMVMV